MSMFVLLLNMIRIDETRNEQVIVFREKTGGRFLPVVIGTAEVNAIKLKLSGMTPPRPLTHDLLLQVMGSLGAKLEKVVIDRIQENTFFAKLHLTVPKNGAKKEGIVVDSRPSDGVALAVRANAPIYVEEEVMRKAGVNEV
jgi:bifunctional DNase/RNase